MSTYEKQIRDGQQNGYTVNNNSGSNGSYMSSYSSQSSYSGTTEEKPEYINGKRILSRRVVSNPPTYTSEKVYATESSSLNSAAPRSTYPLESETITRQTNSYSYAAPTSDYASNSNRSSIALSEKEDGEQKWVITTAGNRILLPSSKGKSATKIEEIMVPTNVSRVSSAPPTSSYTYQPKRKNLVDDVQAIVDRAESGERRVSELENQIKNLRSEKLELQARIGQVEKDASNHSGRLQKDINDMKNDIRQKDEVIREFESMKVRFDRELLEKSERISVLENSLDDVRGKLEAETKIVKSREETHDRQLKAKADEIDKLKKENAELIKSIKNMNSLNASNFDLDHITNLETELSAVKDELNEDTTDGVEVAEITTESEIKVSHEAIVESAPIGDLHEEVEENCVKQSSTKKIETGSVKVEEMIKALESLNSLEKDVKTVETIETSDDNDGIEEQSEKKEEVEENEKYADFEELLELEAKPVIVEQDDTFETVDVSDVKEIETIDSAENVSVVENELVAADEVVVVESSLKEDTINLDQKLEALMTEPSLEEKSLPADLEKIAELEAELETVKRELNEQQSKTVDVVYRLVEKSSTEDLEKIEQLEAELVKIKNELENDVESAVQSDTFEKSLESDLQKIAQLETELMNARSSIEEYLQQITLLEEEIEMLQLRPVETVVEYRSQPADLQMIEDLETQLSSQQQVQVEYRSLQTDLEMIARLQNEIKNTSKLLQKRENEIHDLRNGDRAIRVEQELKTCREHVGILERQIRTRVSDLMVKDNQILMLEERIRELQTAPQMNPNMVQIQPQYQYQNQSAPIQYVAVRQSPEQQQILYSQQPSYTSRVARSAQRSDSAHTRSKSVGAPQMRRTITAAPVPVSDEERQWQDRHNALKSLRTTLEHTLPQSPKYSNEIF